MAMVEELVLGSASTQDQGDGYTPQTCHPHKHMCAQYRHQTHQAQNCMSYHPTDYNLTHDQATSTDTPAWMADCSLMVKHSVSEHSMDDSKMSDSHSEKPPPHTTSHPHCTTKSHRRHTHMDTSSTSQTPPHNHTIPNHNDTLSRLLLLLLDRLCRSQA